MRISDWSSDVFSSDLLNLGRLEAFLKLLPADLSHVFEFRDTSWYNDATLDLLDRFGAGFVAHDFPAKRSEERRVGQECVSKCRYRCSAYHNKKKKYLIIRNNINRLHSYITHS